MISEESRLSVSSQAHLNKWCVSSTNGHVKPWELKPQQKDLMQVVRRPVERTSLSGYSRATSALSGIGLVMARRPNRFLCLIRPFAGGRL